VTEIIRDIIETILIFLSVPTIILSIVVVTVWFSEAKSVLCKEKKLIVPSDYLVVGIVAGFFGSAVNNAFSLEFLIKELLEITRLHSDTTTISVFIKEVFSIIAAYYHIKAYEETFKVHGMFNKVLVMSSIISIVFILMIYFWFYNV
jgi:hypothetical protein